ncbi:MAG: DUF342 domain-containing protein [Candidatus Glassbacteria bacterium]|nr:DUF342 domain-containing protein [Candidatus Glassbacteria bacterium]
MNDQAKPQNPADQPSPGKRDEDPGAQAESSEEKMRARVEITKDKLKAYLTLSAPGESAKFDKDAVDVALAGEGIKFGIRDELLAQLEKAPKLNERLLIAEGTAPKEGKNGGAEYITEPGKPVRVKKGDKIAEIVRAEDGEDGMDVFGAEIPAQEVVSARIPDLVNADYSPDNNKILVATMDGYLHLSTNTLKVQPFFAMENVTDEYGAAVKVTPRLQEDDFGPEELKKYLADSGIVYGVLDDVIDSVFNKEKFDQPVLVARGLPPVDGSDGELEFFFETEIKPRFDEKGNVDFKELNLIQNVKKGDKLVRITDPVEGKEGKTIFGKTVAPGQGEKPAMPKGDNTSPDPGDPDVLVTDIDGTVKKVGDVVQVDPIFAVKGDIDYSVGNIDFIGAVVINGDVKSGFRIKSSGDIEINGIVEDAEIECGGDVLIKMGFIGRGEGKITAAGSVTARYCVNQQIYCDGDINIGEYIMHSHVQARGCLLVTEKKGLIVGGECCAFKGIEANILGNDNFTHTLVMAGVDRETGGRMKQVRARLWKNAEHLKEIDKILNKSSRRQLVKKALPPDRLELIATLNKIRKKKVEIGATLGAELKELEAEGNIFKKAYVKVYGTIFPGVALTLGNKHVKIEEDAKGVMYTYSEDGVVTTSLEKNEETG